MSYDLFFTSTRPVTRQAVHGWLSQQQHAFPSEHRVGFENDATGVHFGFDFDEDAALPAFNLNYVRPHVFGLEAERLLTAFVRHFGLEVDDPQADGMGQGPYSPEGFLRGWNAGNRFGYRVFCSHCPRSEWKAAPRAVNHMAWTWNLERPAIQALLELDESLPPAFVPAVFFVEDEQGRVSTISMWTGDMPLLFAALVDTLVIPTATGNGLVARAEVLRLCEPVVQWGADKEDARGRPIGTPSIVIDAPDGATLQQLQAKAAEARIRRVGADEVLDLELLEEVSGG